MRVITLFTLALLPFCSQAQIVTTFESLNLPTDSVLNNAGAAGSFEINDLVLNNSYFQGSGYEVWGGWAISAATDNVTPGYLNQYSAITGAGYNGSTSYAVGYAFDPIWMRILGSEVNNTPVGMYITNGTYPYLSMRDGDSYSKKFGGATGDDPDFFKLIVRAKEHGTFMPDSVVFYLADFRFSDNSQDYILNDWEWLDLSIFNGADSLMFSLSSSDNNAFGMVTPGYFCADNIETYLFLSNKTVLSPEALFTFAPNPSNDFILIRKTTDLEAELSIIANNGQSLLQRTLNQAQNRIDIGFLPEGIYTILVKSKDGISTQSLIKQ